MLETLRSEVCRLNRELARTGLVAWTSGNVSARDAASGLNEATYALLGVQLRPLP